MGDFCKIIGRTCLFCGTYGGEYFCGEGQKQKYRIGRKVHVKITNKIDDMDCCPRAEGVKPITR
jgi:hypothetical protein